MAGMKNGGGEEEEEGARKKCRGRPRHPAASKGEGKKRVYDDDVKVTEK